MQGLARVAAGWHVEMSENTYGDSAGYGCESPCRWTTDWERCVRVRDCGFGSSTDLEGVRVLAATDIG